AMRRLVFRVARRARRPFTSAEAARFLAAVERCAPRRVDYLAFRLLARTGSRIGEMCALRLDHVDLQARLLHIAATYHGPGRFRHAAATHLCEAGVNVMVVRDLLGHADLQTTMMYAKRATVQDAAAIARLDGFGL